MLIAGMMSGTSVDSIDVAICDVAIESGRISATMRGFYEHPMPDSLRTRIFRMFDDEAGSLALTCSLNVEIGVAFADAVQAAFESASIDPRDISAIASHGQTAYHIAPHMVETGDAAGHVASTLQIGEAAVIAERTGIRVISDFRVADMAAGGNGAPLVPFADFHLFSQAGAPVILQNIGGIANCTALPASGKIDDVIAFDTGPGNMIIDGLVHHFFPDCRYDRDGKLARAGKVMEDLLSEWMEMPYIAAPPPKSTGRELFGLQFAARVAKGHPYADPHDLIATATAFTAASIAENVARHVVPKSGPVAEMLVAGGGAQNIYLLQLLQHELRERIGKEAAPDIRQLDETGFASKARECVAFAILGYARLLGIPGNVPGATGARHPALLGKIVDPPPASRGVSQA